MANLKSKDQSVINEYLLGKSSKEVAKLLEVSPTHVLNVLRRNDIPIRVGRQNYTRALENVDTKYLSDLYSEHRSLNVLADILDVDSHTVAKELKRRGISYLPKLEYDCNKQFFALENRSRLQYYWAGFLAADGTVASRKNDYTIKLSLSTKDKAHVEAFKKDLSSAHPIKDYWVTKSIMGQPPKRYFSSNICICSKEMVADLSRFNVVPRKTYTYTVPEFMFEDEYANSFVLGFIDGDGWTTITDEEIMVGICGCEIPATSFRNLILKYLPGIEGSFFIDGVCKNGVDFYKFEIGGNLQVGRVFEWLYKDSERHLGRKFDLMSKAPEFVEKHDYTYGFNKDVLAEAYERIGTLEGMAREFGCDPTTISDNMKKFGLTYDSRRYSRDEDYFSESNESEEQFYWAGYLMGKSSIYDERKINIVDRNIKKLESFIAATKSDNKVGIISTGSGAIHITSEKMVSDLARFGVVAGKELDCSIPDWLMNHPYIKHFIRGRFDARGSLSKGGFFELTGPEVFLNNVRFVFDSAGIKTLAIPRKKAGINTWRLTYTGKASEKVSAWLGLSATTE
jgi:hypothetical protein